MKYYIGVFLHPNRRNIGAKFHHINNVRIIYDNSPAAIAFGANIGVDVTLGLIGQTASFLHTGRVFHVQYSENPVNEWGVLVLGDSKEPAAEWIVNRIRLDIPEDNSVRKSRVNRRHRLVVRK